MQKNYISNHGKPTTNYKSMHFIINNKELTEEEVQNYISSDPYNEITKFYQNKGELFKKHYHIKLFYIIQLIQRLIFQN
jgi:hypothetical protein